jgi:transposase|tara:strand:- start:1472 stop:1822 length:351 start_codon:yes stop_codon:yes gene_type:complete
MLTDGTWSVLSKVMYLSGRIYNKPDHRKTLEGILYKMRTGIPWRDLPSDFGRWSAIYRRFNLSSKKGILNELFRALSRDVLSGLINIVAVQELLTMNQLERAEVETLRKFILQSIA